MEILIILVSLIGFCGVPLLILGIFAAILYIFRKDAMRQEANWRGVAAQAGLNFMPGTFFKRPSAMGAWRGRALHLFTRTTGTPGDGTSTTYTVITLSLNNSKGIVLTLGEEGLFRQVASLMLTENARIGVEAFDKRFKIHCQPPAAAASIFMQNNLPVRLMSAPSLRIEVRGNALEYRQVNVEAEQARLLWLFELLGDLAAAVEAA